jgi:hypothetical protein
MTRTPTLILNIGMEIGQTGATLTLPEIVQTVERNGLSIARLSVVESDTERTVVMSVHDSLAVPGIPHFALWSVAVQLAQDCIAAWDTDLELGALVGPGSESWGSFTPAFFFDLDGQRLAESVEA